MDSNAVIDFIARIIPQKGHEFVSKLIDKEFLISAVVRIEVLGFKDTSQSKLPELREFLDLGVTLPLDDVVIEQTITLRRSYRKLKLGDSIIAATALVHGLTVVTRNVNDFKSIENLPILNPHNL